MRILAALLVAASAFQQPTIYVASRRARAVVMTNAEVPWHVKTANAWKRVLAKEMGVGEFVGSRAKRIAVKINPMTECITDEECMAEVDEKAEFFEEPPLDRAETLS
mmetsp:Transcript_28820/g.89065  ORF Transcript_28820/g.89065 Transcript_28820/m.89065 type:complete len:107 (-) Transcript_28820:123-443(-)